MKNIQDLRIFIQTAQLGSLSACARQLDMTPATVSAAVKRLENEVDVLLFIRSTRKLRLTQKGEVFLKYCTQAIDLIDEGYAELHYTQQGLSGVIQIAAPSDLGRNHLLGWLDDFMEIHPNIEVNIQLSDSLTDIYSLPVELALRYGKPKDSNLIALPIALNNRRVLCASPDYIAEHGTPQHLDDLAEHNCLCIALNDTLYARWQFDGGGKIYSVTVSGNRLCKDSDAVRRWALAGKGIAYRSQLDIADELSNGRLIEITLSALGETCPLYLICAERRLLTPMVSALKSHLIDCTKQLMNRYTSAKT
ncbi:MAG: LysR family transcriptional regulator [Ostreibacterium sp.]